MKKLETSQIIENILANRVITEREVLLLKRRANRGRNGKTTRSVIGK